MYERGFGIETEYGLSGRIYGAGESRGVNWEPTSVLPSVWHQFRRNGSRIYMDINRHPEVATAMVRRPEDAIAHVYAGHIIIERLARDLVKRFIERSGGARFKLAVYANNVSQESRVVALTGHLVRSWGKIASHESYQLRQMTGKVDLIMYMLPLFPYLATRNILFGTGKWYFGSDEFEISQRGSFCTEETGTSTIAEMQILNLRREHHSQDYDRLHLTLGETNIRPRLLGVRVAMMLALLAMRDDGRLVGLDMPKTHLVMKYSSKTPTAKFYARPREMAALEVQWFYFDQVYDFVRERAELAYLLPWLEMNGSLLELLGGGYDAERLAGHLDWATKKVLLQEYAGRAGVTRARLEGIELEMHRLGSPLMMKIMRRGGYADYLPAIERALTEPPNDTRSYVCGLAADAGFVVDWGKVIVPEKYRRHLPDQKRHIFMLDDPLDAEIPEKLRGVLAAIGKLPS